MDLRDHRGVPLDFIRSRQRMTIAGWVTFVTVLRNPNSALEKLNLSANSINDEVAAALTNALANNSRLRELEIERGDSEVPPQDG